MLPFCERFADTRIDRFAENPALRAAPRKPTPPALVPFWTAWRKDQRFALPALYAAAHKRGLPLAPILLAARHLYAERFARHPDIPVIAYCLAAAHQSITDPTRIACYPTRADARRRREIIMRPGALFTAALPRATPAEIQQLAERYTCTVCAPPVHFIPNTDPDGWARVYARARGFSSCMVGPWNAGDLHHPARFYAYADNDLQLAFLTHDGTHHGDTTARCIVNTRTRCFVRVYGDARLLQALDLQGFQHDPERALDGQRCRAMLHRGRLVAPYIDGTVNTANWDWSSDFCTLAANGDLDCTNTSGFAGDADDYDEFTCDNCGDNEPNDESNYSEYHDQTICNYCRDRHYAYAIVSARGNYSDYVRDDQTITLGGNTYLDDADVLEGHGFVQDEDGDWQDADYCVYLESRDAYVLLDNCTRLDIEHEGDTYAHTDDTRTIVLDGETLTVHEDYNGPTDATRAAQAANRRTAAILATARRRDAQRRARQRRATATATRTRSTR